MCRPFEVAKLVGDDGGELFAGQNTAERSRNIHRRTRQFAIEALDISFGDKESRREADNKIMRWFGPGCLRQIVHELPQPRVCVHLERMADDNSLRPLYKPKH